MDLGLQGKAVLVTAASKGLGRAVATQFAREGARVMIASRNEESLQKTATEIRELTGAEVEYAVVDVAKKEDIDNLFAQVQARFGGLDVLVTNAGGPPVGKLEDIPDKVWEQTFQSNLLSVVRLIRGALPMLRKSSAARILNIASTSVKQPVEGLLLSNTFRAGIAGLAKSLAIELAPDKILINTIAPGRIATDRVRELDELRAAAIGSTPEAVRQSHEQNIPLGRYGTPEEFAKMAVFYGSSANTYVTGSVVLVDGGMVRAL
jgi:3-oxoacyl-[acyl-carrier protein] reductase